MVTSSSRLAYGDCYNLMDRAITDPKGIRVKFARREDAWHFRIRLHTARKIDRVDNMTIYEEGEPMYGRSIYDQLTMRIRNNVSGEVWLSMERVDAREYHVESLSDPEPEPELDLVPLRNNDKVEEHLIMPIQSKFSRRL